MPKPGVSGGGIERLRLFSKERAITTEDESSAPAVVPADVLEGLEAVRQSGAHMVERAHVLVLAKRMGYRQTVRWVEEHPDEYARGISHGFVADENAS